MGLIGIIPTRGKINIEFLLQIALSLVELVRNGLITAVFPAHVLSN